MNEDKFRELVDQACTPLHELKMPYVLCIVRLKDATGKAPTQLSDIQAGEIIVGGEMNALQVIVLIYHLLRRFGLDPSKLASAIQQVEKFRHGK